MTNTETKHQSFRGPGKTAVLLRVNKHEVAIEIEPRTTLLDALRNSVGLTGTKRVCDHGECGACTVLVDGKAVYACMTLAIACEGCDIETIEGLSEGDLLHPIQRAFIQEDGFQCGFCTAGQVMSAKALLDHSPDPGPSEIKRGMSGNLCRCGAYAKILRSVQRAAELLRESGEEARG